MDGLPPVALGLNKQSHRQCHGSPAASLPPERVRYELVQLAVAEQLEAPAAAWRQRLCPAGRIELTQYRVKVTWLFLAVGNANFHLDDLARHGGAAISQGRYR